MKLKETLGVLGGGLGALYTMGYLVAAGHARVLGLPVRSTDPAPLLGAAWEFLIRGTVIVVLRVVEAITVLRLAILVAAALVVAIILVVPSVNAWARRRAAALGRRVGRPVRTTVVSLTALCVAIQLWHLAVNVVPTSALNGLLPVRNAPSMDQPSLFQDSLAAAFLERQVLEIRRDLIGNRERSDTRRLSGRYTVHVAVAFGTAFFGWLLWRESRRRHLPRVISGFAIAPMIGAGLLFPFTPLCYGVLLKSYQYPLVTIVSKLPHAEHENLKAEFDRAFDRTQFLLETTGDDLYLYDANDGLSILARDGVAMIRVLTRDFVFRNPR
jgi:hypothetical protein